MIILYKEDTQQMWAVVNPDSTDYVTLAGSTKTSGIISVRLKLHSYYTVAERIDSKLIEGYHVVPCWRNSKYAYWRERIEKHLMWQALAR